MVLFPKHLGSLLTSIPNRFDPKNNPEKQVKSTLGMQQLNQQEFNNVLQELHFLSFNLTQIAKFKQFSAWVK